MEQLIAHLELADGVAPRLDLHEDLWLGCRVRVRVRVRVKGEGER